MGGAENFWTSGISIGRKRICNLRFANDTILIASNEDEMELVNLVKIASKNLTVYTNPSKIKVTGVDWVKDAF